MTSPSESAECLVVMAKQPEAGKVKTRLAPRIGTVGAATLYGAFLDDVLTQSPTNPGRERTRILAFAPSNSRNAFQEMASTRGWELHPQRGENLSERMEEIFASLLERFDRVVMRNSDSPDLDPSRIDAAFTALEKGSDSVFGPDLGGGYEIVGLRRCAPGLFSIPMSTGRSLADTLEVAGALGLTSVQLESGQDVDTPADLDALIDRLTRESARRARCPRTWDVLGSLALR